jgi:hypothetical protein
VSILLCASLAGCGGDSGQEPELIEGDADPVAPMRDISVEELWKSPGDGEHGFLTTEILGGMVEVGERIWVGNPGEQNILVLDRGGAVVGTVGRAGQGPGEFQTVASLAVDPAGLVAAYDVGAMSIQMFDANGEFRERIRVSLRVWNPKGFVATDDGFVISGGVQGSEYAIHRIDRAGELVESWYQIPEPTDPNLDRQTAASNALYVAGGPLDLAPDGSLLFSRAAPHAILRFARGRSAGEVLAQDNRLLESPVNTFTRMEFPKVFFDWSFPQSRGVYALSQGHILNIVTFDAEDRSLWQLYELDGTPAGLGDVPRAYLTWSVTSAGTVLASYQDTDGEVYATEVQWTAR